MPHGRKEVITEIVKPAKQQIAYDHIERELEAGRQAYIICPRIEEAEEDKLYNPLISEQAKSLKNMKSVVGEAKRLKKEVFKKWTLGVLHGKMKPAEKEKIMSDFLEKKIDILVATSVVEVGVNVPNASIILIEHAERYGLSQLHQLRGRVIRGNHQPYCYLATETDLAKSIERLQAIKSTKNGFELAEMDLKLRGAGDLYGDKQWGVTDIAMDAIRNLKMVEAARKEAQEIVAEDLTFSHAPNLAHELALREKVHFE
jgi:ATP-dependent DNA helicase RecG